MDEISKSRWWRARGPGLLEELRGMLFFSALGHLLLLISLGILASAHPSGPLPPPVYRVNLVDLFGESPSRPPATQPPEMAPPKTPPPAPQVARPSSPPPEVPRSAESRSAKRMAPPKPRPLPPPAAPLSPAPKVEKRPRSSQLKMVEPVPGRPKSRGANREAVASMLQPAVPPPAASAESKALEGLLKERLSSEDLPSLPPSPSLLASGPKEKAPAAPAPKGLTVGPWAAPGEAKGRGPTAPPSWLTPSGAESQGQRPSSGALASPRRPEGEEILLSRPITPLSQGAQSAGAIQPKASGVPLPLPQPAASGEGKKGPGREKIAPYLLGEASNSASAGSASSSRSLPTLPPPPEKAGEAFTPPAPLAKGGASPKGAGLESLLSQKYIPLDTQDPQWAPYMRQAAERIKKVWRYPEEAKPGLKGVVELGFIVEKDGSVSQVEIIRSSGHSILDRAAAEDLQRASPLQPLPAGVRRQGFSGKFKYNMD